MADIFVFDVVNTQVISGKVTTTAAINIAWGDGNDDNYNGVDQNWSHDYGSAGNRTVTITGADESVITRWTMTQAGANVEFALSGLPAGLTYFSCAGNNTVSGPLSGLPAGLTYFSCTGNNTVSGPLSGLPAGLTYFYCAGNNTVSGPLSGLPAGLTDFYCTGNNTVSGPLSGLPAGLTDFSCTGNNTISGPLSGLPAGLTHFYCTGNNTVSGYTYPRAWPASMNRVHLVPAAGDGLSNREIDELLADLADTTWVGSKEVVLTGTNSKYSIFGDTAQAWLLANLTTLTLNGRVTDIDAGVCTVDKLYRIGTTEVNHYFVGCAVGDYFVSDGTETNDVNNTVLEVTHLGTDAVTIVSEPGGVTQNWAEKTTGFNWNDLSGHSYEICRHYGADGMGGLEKEWVDIAIVWASIWPISANEQIQSSASTMIASHRIRMRYRSDIKANWRLKYHNSYYNIVSIINHNMANRMLELLVKEAA